MSLTATGLAEEPAAPPEVPPARRRTADRLRPLALPAAGGAVASLVLPPFDIVPAHFVGLAMLALSLASATSLRGAAARGLAFGFVGDLIGFRFVVETVDRFGNTGPVVGVLALVVLALFQGLAWAGCGALAHALRARLAVPLPLAFASGVFVAGTAPGVFVWTPASLIAPLRPELVQLADLVGERGVSFLLALAVGLVVHAFLVARDRRPGDRTALGPVAVPALAGVLLLLALDVAGGARMDAVADRASAGSVRLALLDSAAPPKRTLDEDEQRRRLDVLRGLSTRAEAMGADLVVWPEGAYPIAVERGVRRIDQREEQPVDAQTRVPRLIGLRTVDEDRRRYNSATIVSPEGLLQTAYDKMQLIWIGETVPGASVFPFLNDVFGRTGLMTAGEDPTALTLERTGAPAVRLGTLICYEDVGPSVARRVASDLNPQLLVNITNDAWFVGTDAPELQARLAVMRAVETRTGLVRAVNGGNSGWVDATGRIRVRQAQPGPSITMADPVLRTADAGRTPYVRFGDAPMWILLGAIALGCTALRRRTVSARAARR